MEILFIGWNENGEKCLTALLKKSYKIKQVVVPTGYDTAGMFKIAKKHSLPVYEYQRDLQKLEEVARKVNPDLIIIASFPKLIPASIINMPKLGVINTHTGELPKYRGFHPLNWAIVRDEPRIGVTIQYIDEGMDTGDILAQGTVEMTNEDDILTIKEKTTTLGAELIVGVVDRISKSPNKKVAGRQQRDSQALFAPKRTENDGKIKWSNNSRDIFNLVRALKTPYPNAFGLNKSKEKVSFAESYVPKVHGEVIGKLKALLRCYDW